MTPELVSDRRRSTPKALRKDLSGDLERVVGMCLRKEPRRRYASAAALGEDIRRYLDGGRSFARPDSVLYRSRKFVSRNRVPVGMAAAAILALSASLGFSLREGNRARVALAQVVEQRDLADQREERLRSLRTR